MKILGLSFWMLVSLAFSVQAEVPVYYWNFNDAFSPLASNIGGASAEVVYVSVGTGSVYLGVGTETNALTPGASPNYSLGAGGILDAYQLETVTFKDLNFTSISDGGISFAARTRQLGGFADEFKISYQIGAGAWSPTMILATPTSGWSLYQIDFGGALDGLNHIQIKLTYSDALTAIDLHEIDNVQIIPEPSTLGLLLLAAGILSGRLRSCGRRSLPIFRPEA